MDAGTLRKQWKPNMEVKGYPAPDNTSTPSMEVTGEGVEGGYGATSDTV